jgi:peptide-methionine (R)-S-oxide reductase
MPKITLQPRPLSRRNVLKLSLGSLFAAAPVARVWADVLSELSSNPMVTIENFSVKGDSTGVVRKAKVVKSDAQWAATLSPEAFRVTRKKEADHPYTGSYWNSRAEGMYHCVCCDTTLFDSKSKFESGTGWASFWEPASALNITRDGDAFSCSLCDALVGHVFTDGPTANGLRFSAYSLSLTFAAKA